MRGRFASVRCVLSYLAILLLSSCGGSSDTVSIGPPPPPLPPPPPPPPPPAAITVTTSQVFSQVVMTSPIAMMQAPGDDTRWFVIEQSGVVRVFPNMANVTNNDVAVFIDISGRVLCCGESGLLGMAFHRNFNNGNFEVFFSYTRPGGAAGESVISRFRSIDGGLTLDDSMEDIILTIPQPFSNHNGGQIAFDSNGYLYAGFGDGGSGGDPQDHAQNTQDLLGTFIRIDVDGIAPYEIPTGNPFEANAANPCTQGVGGGNCPEIFAWGLRNPWRWSFDRNNGDLWVGDVGQGAWEEIDRIEAGNNYGWNIREGAHCYPPGSACNSTGLIEPITEYDRTQGTSVTGGYVYRGTAIPELQGSYVYGDFSTGRIWAIPATSPQGTTAQELLNTPYNISSFGEDNAGELYVIHYGGSIHQLVDVP